MTRLIHLSNDVLFIYYLASNVLYLAFLVTAWLAGVRHRQRLTSLRLERLESSPLTPPVTVLVPAHNEEATIVESVRALLGMDYPSLELIVINDGSRDRTLALLKETFRLRLTNLLYVTQIPSAPVRGLYTSDADNRLLVVDKISAGNKADAVNAGLNAATSPYVCVIDADSILEKDALVRIMAGVFSDTDSVGASGGIVRVLNGSRVTAGAVTEPRLPSRPVEVLQVVEYLRAFLVGRQAWAALDMLPIISGAFGVFRRDLVMQVGGFRREAIGEDIDLIVRIHRWAQESRQRLGVRFLAEPTCWTQVPATLRSLKGQRQRWHKGLLDVLWKNRDMLFSSRHGRFGWLMLPYLLIFELLAPFIEVAGYTTMLLAAVTGVLSTAFFLQFVMFGYAFATLISIGSVVQEEVNHRRYNRPRDVALLLAYCFLEHFPYRQLNMFWRVQAVWQYCRGDLAWGALERKAVASH